MKGKKIKSLLFSPRSKQSLVAVCLLLLVYRFQVPMDRTWAELKLYHRHSLRNYQGMKLTAWFTTGFVNTEISNSVFLYQTTPVNASVLGSTPELPSSSAHSDNITICDQLWGLTVLLSVNVGLHHVFLYTFKNLLLAGFPVFFLNLHSIPQVCPLDALALSAHPLPILQGEPAGFSLLPLCPQFRALAQPS